MVPRFAGLKAASGRTSRIASATSKKRDTRPELALRRAVWRLGLRYRVDDADLPGRPDLSFRKERVAVFCDGDFWHGNNLAARVAKLTAGHNAPYWVAKITANEARDRRHDQALTAAGWAVLRYWESEVLADAAAAARAVYATVISRR